jgi:hypothetical protein
MPPWSNGSTWNGITEGNLIPIILIGGIYPVSHLDSLNFIAAIGACNGNWQDSPPGSVEREQKRALYLLSNDPQVSYTKRGMRVTFHAYSTRSSILAYEANTSFINKAESTLSSAIIRIIKKEVQGRMWAKGDVVVPPDGRLSYMNSNSADMTDLVEKPAATGFSIQLFKGLIHRH